MPSFVTGTMLAALPGWSQLLLSLIGKTSDLDELYTCVHVADFQLIDLEEARQVAPPKVIAAGVTEFFKCADCG